MKKYLYIGIVVALALGSLFFVSRFFTTEFPDTIEINQVVLVKDPDLVTDSGIAISRDDYSVLLKPFYSTQGFDFYFAFDHAQKDHLVSSSISSDSESAVKLAANTTFILGKLIIVSKNRKGESMTYLPYKELSLLSRDEADLPLESYGKYGASFGCRPYGQINVLKEVDDTQLTKIGSWQGNDVYELNNFEHPLYKYAYLVKFPRVGADMARSPVTWENDPTFAGYVSKHPLLIIKDPWGHYLILQESDHQTPYCG